MSERDHLERTILTVRNHRDALNCWPQWANIFADEIERLWTVEDRVAALEAALERILNNAESWHGPPPDDSGHVRALAVIARCAEEALEAVAAASPESAS